MSAAARQMEKRVFQTLIDAGASILSKDMDGSGHRKVTYRYNGHEFSFHFPSTPRANGHSPLNVVARLRRLLREAPPPPVVSAPLPVLAVPPEPAAPPTLTIAVEAAPLLVKSVRLDRARRREIAKRYLALRDLDRLSDETGLAVLRLQHMLLSHGGDIQSLVRREINARRQSTYKNRTTRRVAEEKAVAASGYTLTDIVTSRLDSVPDNNARNIQIARLVYEDGVDIEVIAQHLQLKPATITMIARNAMPSLHGEEDI